jgi:hypothetical protein
MEENDKHTRTKSSLKKKYVAYFCPVCCEPSHLKVHRSWVLKRVLFFLPVRKYFCSGCKKPYYVNIKTAKGIRIHETAIAA